MGKRSQPRALTVGTLSEQAHAEGSEEGTAHNVAPVVLYETLELLHLPGHEPSLQLLRHRLRVQPWIGCQHPVVTGGRAMSWGHPDLP